MCLFFISVFVFFLVVAWSLFFSNYFFLRLFFFFLFLHLLFSYFEKQMKRARTAEEEAKHALVPRKKTSKSKNANVTKQTFLKTGNLPADSNVSGKNVLPCWLDSHQLDPFLKYVDYSLEQSADGVNAFGTCSAFILTEQTMPTLVSFFGMSANEKISFYIREEAVVLHCETASSGAKIYLKLPAVNQAGQIFKPLASGSSSSVSGPPVQCQSMTAKFAVVVPEEWRKRRGYHANMTIDASVYSTFLKKFNAFKHLCAVLVCDVEHCKVSLLIVPKNWQAAEPVVVLLGIMQTDNDDPDNENFEDHPGYDYKKRNLLLGDIAPPAEDPQEHVEPDEVFTAVDVNDQHFRFVFDVSVDLLRDNMTDKHMMYVQVVRNAMKSTWNMRLTFEPETPGTVMKCPVPIEGVFKTDFESEGSGLDQSLLFSRVVTEVLAKYLKECEALRMPTKVRLHFDPDTFMFLRCGTKYAFFNIFLGPMEK